jgi:hypothetical protein
MVTINKCVEETKWVLWILVYVAKLEVVDLFMESRVGGILLACVGPDAF